MVGPTDPRHPQFGHMPAAAIPDDAQPAMIEVRVELNNHTVNNTVVNYSVPTNNDMGNYSNESMWDIMKSE